VLGYLPAILPFNLAIDPMKMATNIRIFSLTAFLCIFFQLPSLYADMQVTTNWYLLANLSASPLGGPTFGGGDYDTNLWQTVYSTTNGIVDGLELAYGGEDPGSPTSFNQSIFSGNQNETASSMLNVTVNNSAEISDNFAHILSEGSVYSETSLSVQLHGHPPAVATYNPIFSVTAGGQFYFYESATVSITGYAPANAFISCSAFQDLTYYLIDPSEVGGDVNIQTNRIIGGFINTQNGADWFAELELYTETSTQTPPSDTTETTTCNLSWTYELWLSTTPIAPPLTYNMSGGGLTLSWLASAASVILQQADVLTTNTAWSNATNISFPSGSNSVVNIDTSLPQRFYRLVPGP
jgi:hypothetical protein